MSFLFWRLYIILINKMTLLAFAILDSFFPLCRQCDKGWKKLRDEQMPAIEMNYIIVVMIFPKSRSANCNIFYLTTFVCVFVCVCVCVCMHAFVCCLIL